jgi:hypothetical protein
MSHPLDGARLKVIRAQEHLDGLNAEVGMYLDQQPQEVRSQPERAPQHTWLPHTYVMPPIIPSDPPPRLSIIIGDCVTNARAALDYIMWELADRHFKPRLDIVNRKGDKHLAAFPILTKNAFQTCSKCLAKRKIPADAITELERAQPYNAGYEPLLWLNELVNRDKHRALLLTVTEIDLTVELRPWHLGDIITETRPIAIPRNLATNKSPAFQSDMPMKGKVISYVTWKDVPVPSVPIDRTLEQIIKCVANIVPRFDSFFG